MTDREAAERQAADQAAAAARAEAGLLVAQQTCEEALRARDAASAAVEARVREATAAAERHWSALLAAKEEEAAARLREVQARSRELEEKGVCVHSQQSQDSLSCSSTECSWPVVALRSAAYIVLYSIYVVWGTPRSQCCAECQTMLMHADRYVRSRALLIADAWSPRHAAGASAASALAIAQSELAAHGAITHQQLDEAREVWQRRVAEADAVWQRRLAGA